MCARNIATVLSLGARTPSTHTDTHNAYTNYTCTIVRPQIHSLYTSATEIDADTGFFLVLHDDDEDTLIVLTIAESLIIKFNNLR